MKRKQGRMNLVLNGWLLRSHTLHNHAHMHIIHPHMHKCTLYTHTCTPHTCTLYTHIPTLDTHTCVPTHAYPYVHTTHMHIIHPLIHIRHSYMHTHTSTLHTHSYLKMRTDPSLFEIGSICAGQRCGQEFWNIWQLPYTYAIVLLHCKTILGCFNLIPC